MVTDSKSSKKHLPCPHPVVISAPFCLPAAFLCLKKTKEIKLLTKSWDVNPGHLEPGSLLLTLYYLPQRGLPKNLGNNGSFLLFFGCLSVHIIYM